MLCQVIFAPLMYFASTTSALGFRCSKILFKFHLHCFLSLLVLLSYFCPVFSMTLMVRARIHAIFMLQTYRRVSFVVIVVHAQLYATIVIRIHLRATYATPFSSVVQWVDFNVELPPSSKNRNSQAFLRFTWFMLNNIYSASSINHTNLKKACELSFFKLSGSSKVTFSHCTYTLPTHCRLRAYLRGTLVVHAFLHVTFAVHAYVRDPCKPLTVLTKR